MQDYTGLITIRKPGYAHVIIQTADPKNLYSPEEGIKNGTIFPNLDKPFGFYGHESFIYEIEREETNE
jgi:hypothetical protein